MSRVIWACLGRRCAAMFVRSGPIRGCGRICSARRSVRRSGRCAKEVYELRRANGILGSASVFFAKELDPDRPK